MFHRNPSLALLCLLYMCLMFFMVTTCFNGKKRSCLWKYHHRITSTATRLNTGQLVFILIYFLCWFPLNIATIFSDFENFEIFWKKGKNVTMISALKKPLIESNTGVPSDHWIQSKVHWHSWKKILLGKCFVCSFVF